MAKSKTIASSGPGAPGDAFEPGKKATDLGGKRVVLFGLLVFGACWLGNEVSSGLRFPDEGSAILYLPYAILTVALLLSPPRHWWVYLLASFFGHLLPHLDRWPTGWVLLADVANFTRAVVAAACIRHFNDGVPRFDSLRGLAVFFVFGVFLAPGVSALIGAAIVNHYNPTSGYWLAWQAWFLSNALTGAAVLPALFIIITRSRTWLREASTSRLIEAGLLISVLLALSVFVFIMPEGRMIGLPASLYGLLPILLWSAVRFGSGGASLTALAVSSLAISGAVYGHGPFSVTTENLLSMQLFLIVAAIPLMFLGAVINERGKAEERFMKAFHSSPDAVVICRQKDCHILEVNKRWEKMFGHRREEAIGRTAVDLKVYASDADREKLLAAISARGTVRDLEVPVVTRTGEVRQARVSADTDEIAGEGCLILIIRDITDRIQAERALRASEERNRAILEGIPDLMFVLSRDGVYLDYHAKDPRDLVVPPEQFLGRNLRDVLPPDQMVKIQWHLDRLFKTGESEVFDYALPIRGGMRVYETRLVRIGDDKVLSVVRDITDRQRAEEALRESERRFRIMADAAPLMIWMTGTSKLCTYVSQGWLDFTGRELEQELGNGWIAGVHPDDVGRCLQVYTTSFDKRVPFKMEYRTRRRDGEFRWVVDQGTPRWLPTGEFMGYIGSAVDITERKLGEQALQVSEERYREVVESQTDLVCRYLPDTTLTFVNEAYCRFFGCAREELIGRKFLELIPQAAWDSVLSHIALLGKERRTVIQEHEALLPDGGTGWQHWVDYAIVDPDGRVVEFQGIGRDITDRKRAEEARQNLAHASRLAVVGELTAMIAHEVNQPLGAILSNADAAEILLASKKPPLEEIHQILIDIRANDLRASEAIRRIRALLQKREMEMLPLDLNETLADVLRLVTGDAMRRRVQLRRQFTEDLPQVRGDRVHLQQVMLNLILNSMDAMADIPEAGRCIAVRTARNGDNTIEVAVEDAGHGIPENKLSRVFDSFFTTKKEGMGLGLSIARSIIEAHQGRIWAENNQASGVTFRFILPFDGVEDPTAHDSGRKRKVQP